MRARGYSRSKSSSDPITPTDVKQYVYCPLITYYHRVLGLEPILDYQQQESKELHEELRSKVPRRKYPLKDRKLKDYKPVKRGLLYSKRLNILGRPDLILESPDGELAPVDFKYMGSRKGKAWPDHRAQIGLYALLIEDNFRKTVYRGFVYYIPEELAVEVRITPQLRKWVISIVEKIREMDIEQKPPEAWRNPENCSGGCGYLHVCRGSK